LYEVIKKVIWLRQFLSTVGHTQTSPTTIHCDNQASIRLSYNLDDPRQNKHVDNFYHFSQEQIEVGEMIVKYYPSFANIVDLFTKGLPTDRYCSLRSTLSISKVTETS